ncbi:DUF6515 family protein [Candidatus Omnitrophota bacterium]
MKQSKNVLRVVVVGFLSFLIMFQTTNAHAWFWRVRHGKIHRKHYIKHDHYPHGKSVVHLPLGFMTLTISGKKVFYNNGVYYHRKNRKYVVVSAPIGASIPHLPYGYKVVVINGMHYYHHKGVYYLNMPTGYVVVPKPIVQVVAPPVQVVSVGSNGYIDGQKASSLDSIELNIPNNGGGYSVVKLNRFEGGFVGPQGEYYNKFPTVGQLQVIYGDVKK